MEGVELQHDYIELFGSLERAVPPVCWQILRLARVIRTEQALARQLAPLFERARGAANEGLKDELSVPIISSHDPHIVFRRIKGVEELHKVLASDLALYGFEDLCLAAEERKLLVRDWDRENHEEHSRQIRPVGVSASSRLCSGYEQKLYLLLDRSWSMKEFHRLTFAKAILLEYFRVKRGSGAQLFFRSFDYEPSELFVARSVGDYARVLEELVLCQPAGKGTDVEMALNVAIDDIRYCSPFKNAEILVVTDCLSRMDADAIAERKGNIKIHVVKIGRDVQELTSSELREFRKRDRALEHASDERVGELFAEQLRKQFEQIADLFIEVDDLQPSLLRPRREDLEFVRAEFARLEAHADSARFPSPVLFRRAATLLDFCRLISDESGGHAELAREAGGLAARLERIVSRLERSLPAAGVFKEGYMPASGRSFWKRLLARRGVASRGRCERVAEFKPSLALVGPARMNSAPVRRRNFFALLLSFVRALFRKMFP